MKCMMICNSNYFYHCVILFTVLKMKTWSDSDEGTFEENQKLLQDYVLIYTET